MSKMRNKATVFFNGISLHNHNGKDNGGADLNFDVAEIWLRGESGYITIYTYIKLPKQAAAHVSSRFMEENMVLHESRGDIDDSWKYAYIRTGSIDVNPDNLLLVGLNPVKKQVAVNLKKRIRETMDRKESEYILIDNTTED